MGASVQWQRAEVYLDVARTDRAADGWPFNAPNEAGAEEPAGRRRARAGCRRQPARAPDAPLIQCGEDR